MTYTKPLVSVLGNATGVIESLITGKPRQVHDNDTGMTAPGPAYDLDD
jgi:hypothetical protein